MKSLLLGILLPFSLTPAPNHPGAGNFNFSSGQPRYYVSALSRIGFIKENGNYTLQAGWLYGKDALELQYGYEGFAVLNSQRVQSGYTRLFMPGLTGGIDFGYGFSNRVEERRRAQYLYPAVHLFYQRKKWGLGFNYKQTVCLNPNQNKHWNEALSLQLGGNLLLWRNLWLGADVEKDIRYPVCVSAGLSYLIAEHFLVCLQAQVNPVKYKMGFGYYHRLFQIEIACSYQTPLGFESAVGVAFKFGL